MTAAGGNARARRITQPRDAIALPIPLPNTSRRFSELITALARDSRDAELVQEG